MITVHDPLNQYQRPALIIRKSCILQMLQVDAKKRITIRELLRDSWMMYGYEVPVKWQSKYHASDVDPKIITEMAAYKLVSPTRMSDRIRR